MRHSLSEVSALRELGQDQTRPAAPEAESPGAEFWKSARVAMPTGKTSVHVRLDCDVWELLTPRPEPSVKSMP